MDKIRKKLYEYKLNVPSDMLKELGIEKHSEVDLELLDNGILITKHVNETKLNNIEIVKEEVLEDNYTNDYLVETAKTCEIRIPKEIFDNYNLSERNYSIVYSYDEEDMTMVATLILNDGGNFKYRKDNRLSMKQLFSEYEIAPGMDIFISISNNGNLLLKFKAKKKSQNEIKGLLIHHIVNKEIKETDFMKEPSIEQKDTFKAQIRKRYVITIPNELFKKYELSGAKFNYKINTKFDGIEVKLEFNEKGNFSFQKSNILPLKTLFGSVTTLNEGDIVECILNNNSLSIKYTELKNLFIKSEPEKEEKSYDILEQTYLSQIEKFKERNIAFKFIEERDLPKETLCSRCGVKLTKKDNSMMSGHRICNKCKSKKLNELFKPIKELAKIREKRRK